MGGFTFGGDNKNLAARLLGGNFVQIGGGGWGGDDQIFEKYYSETYSSEPKIYLMANKRQQVS